MDAKNFPVYGKSPLGGNCLEGGVTKGVPLFYDHRAGAYISEQAIEELNDRDISLANAEQYEREQEFRNNIGIKQA